MCFGPGRNVGLLWLQGKGEQETAFYMGNQTLLIPLSIKNDCPFFLAPFFRCHVLYSRDYDFNAAEEVYLLYFDSCTKPDLNPSFPC